jgi:hypothetical protein
MSCPSLVAHVRWLSRRLMRHCCSSQLAAAACRGIFLVGTLYLHYCVLDTLLSLLETILGGTFTTNYESLLDFKFPEISTSKVVIWQAHVDDTTSSKEAACDMIMVMDLMTSIGITVDCEKRCIRWGGTEIPLKTRSILNNDEILHILYNAANEPDILQEAEKR